MKTYLAPFHVLGFFAGSSLHTTGGPLWLLVSSRGVNEIRSTICATTLSRLISQTVSTNNCREPGLTNT